MLQLRHETCSAQAGIILTNKYTVYDRHSQANVGRNGDDEHKGLAVIITIT